MGKASGGGQTWLAGRLGISQQRVSKLVRSEGWTFGRGPWKAKDVPAIKAHLEERRADNNATADAEGPAAGVPTENDSDDPTAGMRPLDKAKYLNLVERTAKALVEREMMLGVYVRKDEVEREWTEAATAAKAELMLIPLLGLKMVGDDAVAMQGKLEDAVRRACRKLAGNVD